jgi:hypothetical protein
VAVSHTLLSVQSQIPIFLKREPKREESPWDNMVHHPPYVLHLHPSQQVKIERERAPTPHLNTAGEQSERTCSHSKRVYFVTAFHSTNGHSGLTNILKWNTSYASISSDHQNLISTSLRESTATTIDERNREYQASESRWYATIITSYRYVFVQYGQPSACAKQNAPDDNRRNVIAVCAWFGKIWCVFLQIWIAALVGLRTLCFFICTARRLLLWREMHQIEYNQR